MNALLVAEFIQGVFSNIHDFTFISAHFNGNIASSILLFNRYSQDQCHENFSPRCEKSSRVIMYIKK
jgi:hypothetical protein